MCNPELFDVAVAKLLDFEVPDAELFGVVEEAGPSKAGSGPVGVFRYQLSAGSPKHSPTVTDFGKLLVTK